MGDAFSQYSSWHSSYGRLVQMVSPDINPYLLLIKEGEKVRCQREQIGKLRLQSIRHCYSLNV